MAKTIKEIQAEILAQAAMLYLDLKHAREDEVADVLRMLQAKYDRELEQAEAPGQSR